NFRIGDDAWRADPISPKGPTKRKVLGRVQPCVMPAGKMVEPNLARPGISERSARERGVVAEVDIEVSAQTGTGGFGRPCRFLIGPTPSRAFFSEPRWVEMAGARDQQKVMALR